MQPTHVALPAMCVAGPACNSADVVVYSVVRPPVFVGVSGHLEGHCHVPSGLQGRLALELGVERVRWAWRVEWE